jgi:hypothetical protein
MKRQKLYLSIYFLISKNPLYFRDKSYLVLNKIAISAQNYFFLKKIIRSEPYHCISRDR